MFAPVDTYTLTQHKRRNNLGSVFVREQKRGRHADSVRAKERQTSR
jgi:hypothetical protein